MRTTLVHPLATYEQQLEEVWPAREEHTVMGSSGFIKLGGLSFRENLFRGLHDGPSFRVKYARWKQVFNSPVNVLLGERLRILAHHVCQVPLPDFKLMLLLFHKLLMFSSTF